MKRTYKYPVDYSTALFSAFDIGSSLIMSKFDLSSNGIREDMIKLTNDLKALENDYQNVCEKIAETGENRQ